jgi:hypothetical protein
LTSRTEPNPSLPRALHGVVVLDDTMVPAASVIVVVTKPFPFAKIVTVLAEDPDDEPRDPEPDNVAFFVDALSTSRTPGAAVPLPTPVIFMRLFRSLVARTASQDHVNGP